MALCRVLRQRVQMRTLTGTPSRAIVVFCTLGNQRRLVRRLEWLTLLPYVTPLPQIWQTGKVSPPRLLLSLSLGSSHKDRQVPSQEPAWKLD